MNDASDDRARGDANNCFVCGPDNPIGLRLNFAIRDEHCVGEFTALPDHVGFDGVTHGGLVFAVLDDAMANWFFLQGARGFTARAEIRYRNPMPIGRRVLVECALVRRKGRLVQLRAEARDAGNGEVYAETEGSFMLDDAGAIPA